MDAYAPSQTSSSSPMSLPHTSPPTTPELSDDGFDIERLPSPVCIANTSEGNSCLASDISHHPTPGFILVIGGLGYIGSHTVLELLREGHNGKSAR